jgi:hypothetical protein
MRSITNNELEELKKQLANVNVQSMDSFWLIFKTKRVTGF